MSIVPDLNVNPVTAPSISWKGLSGQIYQFQLHTVGTIYREIPGVYIFCKLATNGNWDSIYVGETDNLKRRLTDELASHHRWESIVTHWPSHICTLHVPGTLALRLSYETDLRHGLNPPCNRQ